LDLSSNKKSDLGYLRPLNELKNYANRHLEQYLAGFYLHGSFATKDYVKGWSDVDTLAVVLKKTIEDPKSLLEFRNMMYYMRHFLYKIDPLQHHGSIIISEYDLENYCQVYFPVEIFKYAKSFFKEDGTGKVKVRDCSSEVLAKLFWFVNYFRRLNIEKNYNMNSYDTKNLLHCITLFPTVYLNAKGIFVYKKLSFEMAKKDFKKEAWEVIDYASSIRRNWKSAGSLPFIRLSSSINPLLAYQLNSRVMDFFKDIKKINNIDTKYLVENMFRLSEKAWNKIN
jgi:predicted nucleotidyltransferase